ncbi:MAG: transaldolase [Verrucomicrobiales bacterium]|nr:transaldolase [Verrucomicrobiales bacterium]
MKNPLRTLLEHGQSVWLDSLSRSLVTSGNLHRLIEQDGLRGLTSNPSIFAHAIAETGEYQDMLEAPESKTLLAKALYERIAARDIRDAADVLRPVYEATQGRDGYVSLEVSPYLAHHTGATVEEARRLWRTVGRENLMIKVPATPEGIPAVQQLIGEGLNVNVTLLFDPAIYEKVSEAYLSGLESLVRHGGDPTRVASVASFFVSRIDTAVEAWIGERMRSFPGPEARAAMQSLRGKVACANARKAYQRYLATMHGQRWLDLSRLGARSQRLLWASTGTKNPEYRDVLYVEELVGPDTVNTMPPATLAAFRDHGQVRNSLMEDSEEASRIMDQVARVGLPFQEMTERLLGDGIQQFAEAFDKLLEMAGRFALPPSQDSAEHLRVRLIKELYQGKQH